MNGYYLYCIKEADDCKSYPKGINGGEVFTIPFQNLEAVVSAAPLKEFSSEEFQKKAREDLSWIKEKAQVHELVIESAMKSKNGILGVIPMKFGTIFKTKEKLKEILKKHYSEFKKTLGDLAGKQEWGVKIYLNREILEKEIKDISLVVREKEKEIASLPEGIAYFMQKQIDEAVGKEADMALQNYTESFFENLKQYAIVGVKDKILEKELTGKFLPMALNMSFLVSEKKLEDFIKKINTLKQGYEHRGLIFEYSGPWPPYHFVSQ